MILIGRLRQDGLYLRISFIQRDSRVKEEVAQSLFQDLMLKS